MKFDKHNIVTREKTYENVKLKSELPALELWLLRD